MLKYGLLVGLSGILTYEFDPESLISRSDLHLLLPGLLLAGIAVAVIRFGRPRTWVQLLQFTAGIACIVASSLLIQDRAYQWWFRISLAVLLRVVISAGWLLSLLFLITCVLSVRKGTFKWHPQSLRMLKWTFTGFVATVCLELSAAALLPPSAQSIALPDLPPGELDGPCLIAAIGGSTMTGFPYAPEYGIAQAAITDLRERYPDVDFELRNLAVTGVNLAMAIGELKKLNELPDVLLVYAGHNEFFHNVEELTDSRAADFGTIDRLLHRSPTFRIINPILAQYLIATQTLEVEPGLFGAPIGSPEVLTMRLRRYSSQLRQLLEWATRNHVAVVYFIPVAAEADFEPNVSVCESASTRERAELTQQWASVRNLQQSGDFEKALTQCNQILQRFPGIAEFEYRAAECLRATGKFRQARQHFQRALDLDGFPIRALSEYRKAGRSLAEKYRVPIVDSDAVLRTISADGLLGSNIFPDGVHPNLKGCFALGRASANAISTHEMLELKSDDQRSLINLPESLARRKVDAKVLSRACFTTHEVLSHYAYFRAFDATLRESESARFLTLSQELDQGTLVPGQSASESLTKPLERFSSTAPTADSGSANTADPGQFDQ